MYQKAFIQYLRQGTPLTLSLKSTDIHPTTYYIWRTSGDSHVRLTHAVNNGKIFAWDNPPPTGHPGEAYGCRCKAEPYSGSVAPIIAKEIRNELLDYLKKTIPWGNREMSLYFFLGNGKGVMLEEIGHLNAIRNYYVQHYLPRFEEQIRQHAASAPIGPFQDSFRYV